MLDRATLNPTKCSLISTMVTNAGRIHYTQRLLIKSNFFLFLPTRCQEGHGRLNYHCAACWVLCAELSQASYGHQGMSYKPPPPSVTQCRVIFPSSWIISLDLCVSPSGCLPVYAFQYNTYECALHYNANECGLFCQMFCSCVFLQMWFGGSYSVPQFPHMKNEDDNNTHSQSRCEYQINYYF